MSARIATAAALALVGCGGAGVELSPPEPWATELDAERVGWVMNVFGLAGDDVWAVGGVPEEATALHWTGDRWSSFSPDVAPPAGLLTWVHGLDSSDLTVTAEQGVVLRRRHGQWSIEDTPTTEHLWGVWVGSDGVAWAVGGAGRPDSTAVLLRRGAGLSSWTEQPLPRLTRPGVRALFKVWGAHPAAVWVVGQNGVILHWDGAAWTEEASGVGVDLIALWGADDEHVVAVGGRSNGVVATWDGSAWRSTTLRTAGLSGVFVRRRGVFHAVGVGGLVLRGRFDDMSIELSAPVTDHDLHTIHGVGDRLRAVGGNLGAPAGPFAGVVIGRPLSGDE